MKYYEILLNTVKYCDAIAQNTAKYCETLWCDVLHKILWRGAGQIVIVAKSGLQWTRERG